MHKLSSKRIKNAEKPGKKIISQSTLNQKMRGNGPRTPSQNVVQLLSQTEVKSDFEVKKA